MPHATTTTTSPLNSHSSSFKSVDRVLSYPVVTDSVETLKANQYARKSLQLADGVYSRWAKPVEPYLETPYSYARPYVSRADDLADSGLGHVETRFPIVKEDTTTILDKAKGLVWWPLSKAGQGRDYVWTTWNDEYHKTASHRDRGPGLTTTALALVSTELKLASDFFQAVADVLGPKYRDSTDAAAAHAAHTRDATAAYAGKAQNAVANGQNEAKKGKETVEKKAHQAQKEAQQAAK